jgi:fatty-acyl-CoA synthase
VAETVAQTAAQLVTARAHDEGVGLRFEDRSWTWRQVVAEAERRARFLEARRGQGPFHVGVLLENVPEYLFLLCGAALAGATVVGINPTRRGDELARDIRHTDCRLVMTDGTLAPLLDGLDIGADIVLVDGEKYAASLEDHQARSASPPRRPAPDDLFLLLFTSGSTGAPKAVKMSHRRFTGIVTTMARSLGFGAGSVLYCSMPMFHGNALLTCVGPGLAGGATLVLRRRFSASGFLPDVRHYGVSYFNYVGRALAYILATPAQPDDADNPLRFAMGTDASPGDIADFRRRFGCYVVEGYGQSEGAISISPVPDMPAGAMGLPVDGADVAVVDEDGTELPRARFDAEGRLANPDEVIGEIVKRDGRGDFEGYYANPDAEAERTRGGWYWSGDLGYRDQAGYFYFAGRTSDWLRVDGENFAAAPVERLLERFDPVRVAVVYAVPDPRTGDQVMATLELDEEAPFDPDAFVAFLDHQPDLGTKWAPRLVRVTAHVPVTASGKVDKRPLRDERWRTADPVWWWPAGERHLRYRRLDARDVEQLERAFEAHGRSEYLRR